VAMGAGVPVGDAEDAPLEQKADLSRLFIKAERICHDALGKGLDIRSRPLTFQPQPGCRVEAFRDNYRRSDCLDNDSFDHKSSRRYFFSLGTGPLGV
jgi:hypothetical protein